MSEVIRGSYLNLIRFYLYFKIRGREPAVTPQTVCSASFDNAKSAQDLLHAHHMYQISTVCIPENNIPNTLNVHSSAVVYADSLCQTLEGSKMCMQYQRANGHCMSGPLHMYTSTAQQVHWPLTLRNLKENKDNTTSCCIKESIAVTPCISMTAGTTGRL